MNAPHETAPQRTLHAFAGAPQGTTATATHPTTTTTTAARQAFRRIPFRTLTTAEWHKAVDTRSARWLIGFTALAAAAIMLVPLLATSTDQSASAYLAYPTLVLTTLLPVVVILTLTSEWTQRSVMSTFTQEPRRSRVVSAKLAVSGWMALGAIVLAALVTLAAVGIAIASGRDLTNDLGAANVAGFVLFVLANILMGAAFGAVLHNSAAAIVLFFVLPTAFGFLGAALQSVGDWVDPSKTFGWLLSGDFDGHVPNIAVSALLWVVLPLAAGFVRTTRREIS